MDNIQHAIIMAIEDLPADDEGNVSITKIVSRVKVDLIYIEKALASLFDKGYIYKSKIGYKLTNKGYYYVWTFEPIDYRLNNYINTISSQLSWLIGLTAILIGLVVFLLFKV